MNRRSLMTIVTVGLCGSALASIPAIAAAKDKKEKDAEPALPPPTAPPGVLVPDMTIKLITVGKYKSGDAKKGSRVNLRVDDDVVDAEGKVLIRKGTPAYGTVTASRKSGLFGKRGLLDISIDYTTAVDGQRVPLRATKARAGKSAAGATIAAVVLLAPLALFIKGGNVTLKEGTEIVGYIDDTLRIGGQSTAAAGSPTEKPNGPLKSILLRNGDRITGRIQGLADGVYTVVTENGTLKLKEKEVMEIKDAEPGGE